MCFIQAMHLQSWITCVLRLLKDFPHLSIIHIFCEFNDNADVLSRRGINAEVGSIHYEYCVDGLISSVDRLNIYNFDS